MVAVQTRVFTVNGVVRPKIAIGSGEKQFWRIVNPSPDLGIAETDLPRVFEAFFTTRSTVGTGIGLFVAMQFVEGHGGRIEIERRRGRGKHGHGGAAFLP